MTDQPTERESVVYDAIDAFQRTHRLPGLQHAQIRGLLAEHLARVLPAAFADLEPVVPVSSPPDQTLRDRIAEAVQHGPTWMLPRSLAEEVADAVLAVLHGLTLRELEQLARPYTPPSRPEPRLPDHTVNEAEAPAPAKQRADCTELEWAQQERARFERLYTRETVRADLAEQRAETAARDADIYQQRLERLGEGYIRERKRADEAEAHRLALSEALGLGAPWDAIHDRATELGLPPLAEDPVAQRLGLVPEPADRAAVLSEAADAVFALNYDDLVSEQDDENLGSMREAWDLGTIHATQLLRRLAAEAQPELEADPQPVSEEFLQHLATAKVREDGAEAPQPEEEAELVCVDECGNCDACGMEPFGTPAEGWREAARFLRRTPRDSTDFSGALRGARLIEDELRRRAEAPQPDTETCAALATARVTNQRLNYEKQRLESELAAYRRAVCQWDIGERGTYISLASLRAIGLAGGRDILGSVRHLKHFQRVEQAEAAIGRVRQLHDRLAEETDLASPDDSITRGAAAKRIAAALDGWNPTGAPQCDVEFENGARCAKPAGHRPPGSDDPHVPEPRPRCPHCNLPHDLDPASGVPAACASILASLADRDAAPAAAGPGRAADTHDDEDGDRG